jgi:hypothetical protein
MKRIFQCFIFACAGVFYGLTANAQEKYPYALSFEPSYIFNNALRINLEKKITKSNWLGINLTGYYWPYDPEYGYGTSNSDFQSVGGLKGLGIGGTFKNYFARKWFIELSAGYTFFDVQNESYGFREYIENDLTFYEYGYMDKQHYYFKKVTTSFSIGIHSTFRQAFFVEPYIGMGLAHSFYDRSYQEKYNETMFGFGYRGPYFLLGVKLGFNIPTIP